MTTMTIKINPIHKAAALGRIAFEEGRMSVPALDPALCEMLKGCPCILAVLEAWSRAWHAANLAAPVPGFPELTRR
jgi:hypothetical protein